MITTQVVWSTLLCHVAESGVSWERHHSQQSQVVQHPQEWSMSRYPGKLSDLPESGHRAHTNMSCLTSAKSNVSLERLIEHVCSQFVQLPESSVISVGHFEHITRHTYMGKLTDFPESGVLLGRLIEHVPGQVLQLIPRVVSHQAVSWAS